MMQLNDLHEFVVRELWFEVIFGFFIFHKINGVMGFFRSA